MSALQTPGPPSGSELWRFPCAPPLCSSRSDAIYFSGMSQYRCATLNRLGALSAALLMLHGSANPAPEPACPFVPATWERLRPSVRAAALRTPHPASLSQECLLHFLQRLRENPAPAPAPFDALQAQVGGAGRFPLDLLSALAHDHHDSFTPSAWREVFALWRRINGDELALVGELTARGEHRRADSLLGAFDAAGELGFEHLVSWCDIALVLGNEERCSRLVCRLGATVQGRLMIIARAHLARFIAQAPASRREGMITSYRDCLLEQPDADTAGVREWAAQTAARHELHQLQITSLHQLATPPASVVDELTALARNHLRRGRTEYALLAARALVPLAPPGTPPWRTAAALLWTIHSDRGNNDSALVWLDQVLPGATTPPPQAVALYQLMGRRERADSLAALVRDPRSRDTLAIRSLLFAGDPQGAWARACSLGLRPHWRDADAEASLWVARTAVMAARRGALASLFDTTVVDPRWEGAGEFLSLRHFFETLPPTPPLPHLWGETQRLLACGRHDSLPHLFAHTRVSDTAALALLAVRAARSAFDAGAFDAAAYLLEHTAAGEGAAGLYLRGHIHLRRGEHERARELLQRVLMEHPRDIYSGRARVLLRRVEPPHL